MSQLKECDPRLVCRHIGTSLSGRPPKKGLEMYERFTDRARKVMQLANQEAQRFQPRIHRDRAHSLGAG